MPTSQQTLRFFKSASIAAIFAVLTACAPTPTPTPTGGQDYEYLPGKDYSWSTRLTQQPYPGGQTFPWSGLTLQAQGLQEQYLSDLTWTSASNGYGPVELNRSNNEAVGGDGKTLSIRGATFTKGLGAHANSTIRYALGGACTSFAATVGIDDEVGGRGTVVFQVYGLTGGIRTKLFDSGLVSGQATAQDVTADLTGVSELQLVVTDGGDNNYYDHADWAGARVMCSAPQPSGDKFLSDLLPTSATNGYGPYERDLSNGEQGQNDGQALTIGGTTYRKGLGTHANSQLDYPLGQQCSSFNAEVGLDDEIGNRGSVVFQVYGVSGAVITKLYDSGVVTGADPARSVSANLAGQDTLRLVITDGGDNNYYDHADWASAKIDCTTQVAAISSVNVSPNTLRLAPGSRTQLTATVNGSGAYNPAVTWSSSATTVAAVASDGNVTALSPGQAVITATSVGDPSKSGSAQLTVDQTSTLPPEGIRINFQPTTSPVPAGYLADTGAAYSTASGRGWVTQDSLSLPSGDHVPLEVTPNARDRNLAGVDPQLNTFIHMQYAANTSLPQVRTPAAWEYALPNGVYTVTLSAGDASNSFDSVHRLSAEGQEIVPAFTPVSTKHFQSGTIRVNLTDGRLTVSASGGSNTKINYVIIAPGDRPSVRTAGPQDAESMVSPFSSVTADVNLPNSAIDLATINTGSVRLVNVATGTPVAATINTSGGGDVIVLQPNAPLSANTRFRFEVTAALKDTTGAAFLPFASTFVSGSPTTSGSTVAFEKVSLGASVPAKPYTSVEIGPDNKLYAATLTGEILRFGILPDGTLQPPQLINSVQTANGGPRTIIGMKFDPASTADNLIMWISNNAFWDGRSNAPDWSGKVSRLSGADLATVQDIVVGLPRSIRDHQTNSVSFRPGEPNALYILQGSNSAMGAPDTAWGNRPEHLLNAALLRLDLSKLAVTPLNVQTSEGGTYNPYAPGAPLSIYASGIRNAYDMVWHTNGQLYVPTNGSAAGGNAPGTPVPLPTACTVRADGPYTGLTVPALNNVGVQNDYLFRVMQGGYYGHPNPARCEWVLNGGNPTSFADPAEVGEYPVGTLPDRNWRGFAYSFGLHASANGVIEEYTLAGNSLLRNKLMVVRYSAGKDIVVLTPGGPNQDIVSAQTLLTGLTNFSPSPLDLCEDRANGNIYVAQLDEYTGGGTITLVRPK